jgi:uncharacterized membrane protein HdeD (DUF308 family)
MKYPKIHEIFNAIFDRRLYGRGFIWKSVFFLGFALIIPSYAFFLFSREILVAYILVFLVYFLISGLFSKNFEKREFPVMPSWLSFLFLMVSILAFAFFLVARVENNVYGMFQSLLLFTLPILAFIISVPEITVLGQRFSLRMNIGLTNHFIDKHQEIWKKELKGFPNSENIVDALDAGRHVASLFDRGSFNLAVLWSCNVMEEIIDAAAKGIIQKDPLKKELFRTETGFRTYPTKLRNFNYVHRQKSCRKSEQMTIDDLWDKVRNQIAHHHYVPTFDQTFGALIIFVSFVEEFPKTLQAWRTS